MEEPAQEVDTAAAEFVVNAKSSTSTRQTNSDSQGAIVKKGGAEASSSPPPVEESAKVVRPPHLTKTCSREMAFWQYARSD